MKPQDILFFLVLTVLLYLSKPKYFIAAGLLSILASIPLFWMWIFFTAQRLTWYAAAFFFIGSTFLLRNSRQVQ